MYLRSYAHYVLCLQFNLVHVATHGIGKFRIAISSYRSLSDLMLAQVVWALKSQSRQTDYYIPTDQVQDDTITNFGNRNERSRDQLLLDII
jgi:hypothetical protein